MQIHGQKLLTHQFPSLVLERYVPREVGEKKRSSPFSTFLRDWSHLAKVIVPGKSPAAFPTIAVNKVDALPPMEAPRL